jgi:hypothetical protein
MSGTSKRLALLLVFFMVTSSLTILQVQPADGQSIYKPSVPEFTVRFVNSSYEVPTRYSTDQFTGEVITRPGYTVDNSSLEIVIKNQQQFSSYESNGQIINFYYNVRTKGHYGQNWTNAYFLSDGLPTQSASDYTILSFPRYSDGFGTCGAGFVAPYGQVDIQVEALIGSIHRDASIFWAPYVFDGQESGWSNTQTITLDEAAPPSAPSQPTATPQSPTSTPINAGVNGDSGNSITLPMGALVGIIAVVVVLVLAVSVLLIRNYKKTATA